MTSFLQTQLEWTEEDIRQSQAVLEGIEREKLDVWPAGNAGVTDQRLETKARIYRERLQTAMRRLERLMPNKDGR